MSDFRVVVLTVSQDIVRLRFILLITMYYSTKRSGYRLHFSSYASGEFTLIKLNFNGTPQYFKITSKNHYAFLPRSVDCISLGGNIELQIGLDATVEVGSADSTECLKRKDPILK
jgi:hypothetical protein